MEAKLEEWQRLTVEALAGERERLAKRIQGITDAMKHYTEEWANGQEGPFDFEQRSDGIYLVSRDETGLAPAP